MGTSTLEETLSATEHWKLYTEAAWSTSVASTHRHRPNTSAVPMERFKQKREAIRAQVMRLINEVDALLDRNSASVEDGDIEFERCIEYSDRILTVLTRLRLKKNATQLLNMDETALQQTVSSYMPSTPRASLPNLNLLRVYRLHLAW